MDQTTNEKIEACAEKIRQSDRRAFDTLFRLLYPHLVRYSQTYTRNHAAGNDIVQDTFVILWQKRHQIKPDRSLKAYLFKIVRNRSLNYLRDFSDREDQLPEDKWNRIEQQKEEPFGTEFGYGQTETANRLAEQLEEWIRELPDRQREAFELSRFEGLRHAEIAEVMEVSEKTVNNHIVTALKYLRTCYHEYEKELKNSQS